MAPNKASVNLIKYKKIYFNYNKSYLYLKYLLKPLNFLYVLSKKPREAVEGRKEKVREGKK